ncbi:MAG: hypothetical protein J1E85_01735 [Ruminococcus sp.]|nr:hypothetical protein [Ruminococcus sp.]
MEPKLRDYIENLFVSAPRTKQAYELKEEIIRNTIERYHDLIADGKAEGEAYNLAIAGIGDINELLQELGANPIEDGTCTDEQLAKIKSRSTLFKTIAVALYILCVTPCIFFSILGCGDLGAMLMFFMISTATGLLIYDHCTKYLLLENDPNNIKRTKTKAIMRAVAIGLYISCPTPAFLASLLYLNGGIGALGLIIFLAAATSILILSKNYNTYTKTDDTMVENFKEFNGHKKQTSAIYKMLVAILWGTISIIYIIITIVGIQTISIAIGGISWIIFIVGIALQQLIKAIFDYMEASK